VAASKSKYKGRAFELLDEEERKIGGNGEVITQSVKKKWKQNLQMVKVGGDALFSRAD